MATAGPANPEQVAAKVKTLINNQLKQILKKEHLLVSGAKAALQSRIIDSESKIAELRHAVTLILSDRTKNVFMITRLILNLYRSQ